MYDVYTASLQALALKGLQGCPIDDLWLHIARMSKIFLDAECEANMFEPIKRKDSPSINSDDLFYKAVFEMRKFLWEFLVTDDRVTFVAYKEKVDLLKKKNTGCVKKANERTQKRVKGTSSRNRKSSESSNVSSPLIPKSKPRFTYSNPKGNIRGFLKSKQWPLQRCQIPSRFDEVFAYEEEERLNSGSKGPQDDLTDLDLCFTGIKTKKRFQGIGIVIKQWYREAVLLGKSDCDVVFSNLADLEYPIVECIANSGTAGITVEELSANFSVDAVILRSLIKKTEKSKAVTRLDKLLFFHLCAERDGTGVGVLNGENLEDPKVVKVMTHVCDFLKCCELKSLPLGLLSEKFPECDMNLVKNRLLAVGRIKETLVKNELSGDVTSFVELAPEAYTTRKMIPCSLSLPLQLQALGIIERSGPKGVHASSLYFDVGRKRSAKVITDIKKQGLGVLQIPERKGKVSTSILLSFDNIAKSDDVREIVDVRLGREISLVPVRLTAAVAESKKKVNALFSSATARNAWRQAAGVLNMLEKEGIMFMTKDVRMELTDTKDCDFKGEKRTHSRIAEALDNDGLLKIVPDKALPSALHGSLCIMRNDQVGGRCIDC